MKNNLSFEKAMEKLEGIVDSLEKGDLTLEGSLKAYEEGVLLSRHCSKILEEAEGKVAMIVKDEEEYKEIDFLNELKD